MTPAASLPLSPAREIEWCCHPGVEEITIEYLGVGGWLMRMGESVLLTAPFFSNPGFLDAGLGRIEADSAAIERFLPPVNDAIAILVGHAHYDHLMDIPYILRRRAPTALLYGSRTAVNLLHGDPDLDPDRLISLEEGAGTHEGPGEWRARLRVKTTGPPERSPS
jgi:L-ascorbate metabolism protein UlaG (beta-lactamase superfamily)